MSLDSITIIESKGLPITKKFLANGLDESYSKAKYFKPSSQEVSSIRELSETLKALSGLPYQCVIRGILAHPEANPDPNKPGYVARVKEVFDDAAHHWVMFDIDNFKLPEDVDGIQDPQRAIDLYIQTAIPSFSGYSYHWQLSSSAGQAKAKGLLKAHIWFWLSKPYLSTEMTAWAKQASDLIDVSPLRTVQVH